MAGRERERETERKPVAERVPSFTFMLAHPDDVDDHDDASVRRSAR